MKERENPRDIWGDILEASEEIEVHIAIIFFEFEGEIDFVEIVGVNDFLSKLIGVDNRFAWKFEGSK